MIFITTQNIELLIENMTKEELFYFAVEAEEQLVQFVNTQDWITRIHMRELVMKQKEYWLN